MMELGNKCPSSLTQRWEDWGVSSRGVSLWSPVGLSPSCPDGHLLHKLPLISFLPFPVPLPHSPPGVFWAPFTNHQQAPLRVCLWETQPKTRSTVCTLRHVKLISGGAGELLRLDGSPAHLNKCLGKNRDRTKIGKVVWGVSLPWRECERVVLIF